MDDFDPTAMPVDVARSKMREAAPVVAARERVDLRRALGRVLASPVTSSMDVPAHTNSAMDGYALSGGDIPAGGTHTLRVLGTSLAGHPFTGTVSAGECVRVMTGAVMPAGTDTVIMQEYVQAGDGTIEIGTGARTGDHVRPAGEDIARGDVVLDAGTPLDPAALGLLASLGIPEVVVYRRLRVAFLSTGDELRSLGEPLGPGQVYDSNRYTLFGMLTHGGFDLVDMGVVPDDPATLRAALLEAAACADVVITSGGVSVGEADFVTAMLEEIGEVGFWKVAIKPGRPVAYGRIGDAVFVGLPGNPVSVMATFLQLVLPMLRHMSGSTVEPPGVFVQARSLGRLRKKAGRVEYQRGILARAEDGGYTVQATGAQGSALLTSMARANCFIVLAHEQGGVEAGETVTVQPFHALF